MRILLFLAIVTNSVDLIATALGIHWLGNREGNPLLAPLAHQHWGLFVALKGLAIPFLILLLNDCRQRSPVLAVAGMILVTFGLMVAVGQWLGWATAFLRVHGVPAF